MYCVRKVTDDLYWVGANDHRLHLFENIHPIPKGVSYNAYLLLDEQSVLFDTVDWSAYRQLQENLDHLLGDKPLDWLVVNHMEPDHGASVEQILRRYPKVKVISTEKSFMLMRQFGFHPDEHECVQVKEGDTHCFGRHTVTFVGAPMVHWPEAMVTFDTTNGALFSADAFGSFIALDGKLFAPTRSTSTGTGSTRPAATSPTSWASTAPTSSCCWARPPASWTRSNSSAPSTVPCGGRTWDISSTSTTSGAGMSRR